ncbi:cysteine synthase CysM [Desertivirga brevis]|uniref:cysteine synthase CysM n=1 Tax=Desertivirga brevis TaxID=2810310 RepID=UPI001A9647E6|nr:cysteine synthase CysM [Pedobacter sp. SYSU D00873]
MASILNLVGNTPLAELSKIFPKPGVKIYAKLEGQNPGGSVKDRAAVAMIEGAIERGELKPGMKLIEPTSGNTGIALALIASLYGYEIELVMPEMASKERIWTMQAFGARVTLIPKEQPLEAVIEYAREKARKKGLYMLDQFSNPDNVSAHYKTTGPEIWDATSGTITHFVSAMGTTGTLVGVSNYLKEKNPGVQIIGVQPDAESQIPGIRRWEGEYVPRIYNPQSVDRLMDVSQEEAIFWTRELVRKEALFSGPSTGGALAAVTRLAEEIDEGRIVFIVCDRGDRYLSTELFAGNKEEVLTPALEVANGLVAQDLLLRELLINDKH